MKLLSSSITFIEIDGIRYEVVVEVFKTVTHLYYKKCGYAYFSDVIILKGKDRQKPYRDVILSDLQCV